MQRIALFEPYVSGHHNRYTHILAEGLLENGFNICIAGPEEIQSGVNSHPALSRIVTPVLREQGLRRHWEVFQTYRDGLRQLLHWNATHVHFLYGDWNMLAIAAAMAGSRYGGRTIVTAHWASGIGLGKAPRVLSSSKRLFHSLPRRRFARNGGYFVVHDENLERSLKQDVVGANVTIVPYPVFPIEAATETQIREYRARFTIDEESKVLLCFGDTRYDKGVDLALSALSRLPPQYHLLIAGRSAHFDSEMIEKMARRERVLHRVHRVDEFIPEHDIGACFGASDVILLPYRKGFSGQSGPLSLGAALGKPVIGARLPVIDNTITRYSLGAVFEPEDVDDMARAIMQEAWNKRARGQREFILQHTPEAFVEAMLNVYRESRAKRQVV